MAITPTSPITGGAQTGLTNPTYGVSVDSTPTGRGKQWAVTSLGGTQPGVSVHGAAIPFTLTYFPPAAYKQMGNINPATGAPRTIPKNVHRVLIRKGLLSLANYPVQVATIDIAIKLPAGCEAASPAEVRAMYSAAIGWLHQQSDGFGDTAISGIA